MLCSFYYGEFLFDGSWARILARILCCCFHATNLSIPRFAFLHYGTYLISLVFMYPVYLQLKLIVLKLFGVDTMNRPAAMVSQWFEATSSMSTMAMTVPLMAIQAVIFVYGTGSLQPS